MCSKVQVDGFMALELWNVLYGMKNESSYHKDKKLQDLKNDRNTISWQKYT